MKHLAGPGGWRRPSSQASVLHGGCLRTLRAEPQLRQAENVRRHWASLQRLGMPEEGRDSQMFEEGGMQR